MRANVEHNHVRHQHVIVMAIETVPVPRIPDSERMEVDALGYAEDGIVHVTARFGYMEPPHVCEALRLLDPAQTEGQIAIDDASYFLSKLEVTKGDAPTMPAWRKHLFVATSYLSADAAAVLRPTARADRDHGRAHRGLGSWQPNLAVDVDRKRVAATALNDLGSSVQPRRGSTFRSWGSRRPH